MHVIWLVVVISITVRQVPSCLMSCVTVLERKEKPRAEQEPLYHEPGGFCVKLYPAMLSRTCFFGAYYLMWS